jgi:nucleotide-binding universal stress UspA family protein
MTSPTPPAAPAAHAAPASILFATDLSSRCDRALDRALIAARQWRSRLVALTVVEPGGSATFYPPAPGALPSARPQAANAPLRRAEQRLRADLAVDDLPLTTRVAQGPVVDAILAARDAEAAGLIVTGVARNEALSRIVLGSAVDALARRSPVPLLVVRSRARAPYRDVVVASDFSPSSRHALEVAAALFPEAGFILFHAFGNPYPTLAGIDAAQAHSDGLRLAEGEAAAFLQACALPDGVRARMRQVLVHGDAGVLLHARGLDRPDELVVLGTQRRSGLAGLLVGSVAQRILEQAQSDVLLVPPG